MDTEATLKAVPGSKLAKTLSAWQLFNLSFGTIVGVGWITVLGTLLGQAGSMGASAAFVAGGVLICLICLCYAELAGLFPAAGGEVVYSFKVFGPLGAFIAGWLLILAYISVCAFEAISVGWIISVLFSDVDGPVLYSFFGEDVRLGSLLIGLCFTFIISYMNVRGANSAASLQTFMTVILCLTTLCFVLFGFFAGDMANLQPYFGSPTGQPGAFDGFLLVLATTPFWFAGFNVIPQALGEAADSVSPMKAGLTILLSVFAAAGFYAAVLLASAMVLPRTELMALDLPAASAFEIAFQSVFLGKLVLVAGLFGLLSTWNAMMFGGARAIFALGRGHILPHFFARLHSRHATPFVAIGMMMVVSVVFTLLGKGAILPIVNTVGTCFASLFLIATCGFLRLRYTSPDLPRPFKAPQGMIVGWVAATLSAGLILLSLQQQAASSESGFPLEWIILVAWGACGAILWRATRTVRAGLDREEQARGLLSGL